MTSKSYEYIMHLWSNIYSSICTTTLPNPWPNPKTGLIPTQYTFHTKSLIQLTILHKLWYKWSDDLNKFIKIVPLNILDLLTPIGLAHWIMDDGHKHGNGITLCTDSFTLIEVELLVSVLRNKFNLEANYNKRTQKGRHIGWRIYISGKSANKEKLISLVKPYFIPSMLYKLGI